MQNFHNKIAQLSINHFDSLPKTGKPAKNEWTVLSCIVQENAQTHNFKVVSLGTGSKCIGKTKMSPNGDILNDSHAEVICRRAFLRYLYEHLHANSEIFTQDDSSKFSCKDSIKFHFFTSHVPCGDVAIFLKQDSAEFGELIVEENKPASLKRPADIPDINNKPKQVKLSADIFRTGAKCLPAESKQDAHLYGFQYHTVGAVRTKPGRGDPTSSVSCSDKISKWCHLGVQGALLSIFLTEPIYLSTFTIAGQTPFCEKAVSRAIFDRLDAAELKSPYRLHKLDVGQSIDCFEYSKAEQKNPCPSSIAWYKSNLQQFLEVAVEGKKQGVTKRRLNTKAGRLKICKVELFRTFLAAAKRLKLSAFESVDLDEITYSAAKSKAVEYQDAWDVLKCNGFKVWTIKDKSLLDFVID